MDSLQLPPDLVHALLTRTEALIIMGVRHFVAHHAKLASSATPIA